MTVTSLTYNDIKRCDVTGKGRHYDVRGAVVDTVLYTPRVPEAVSRRLYSLPSAGGGRSCGEDGVGRRRDTGLTRPSRGRTALWVHGGELMTLCCTHAHTSDLYTNAGGIRDCLTMMKIA